MTSKVVLSEDSRNYDGIISIIDLLGEKRVSYFVVNKQTSLDRLRCLSGHDAQMDDEPKKFVTV